MCVSFDCNSLVSVDDVGVREICYSWHLDNTKLGLCLYLTSLDSLEVKTVTVSGVSLRKVKAGSVGLKCWGCSKLCPPCNPHLVTNACDMVLKSKPSLFFGYVFIVVIASHTPLAFLTSVALRRFQLVCGG